MVRHISYSGFFRATPAWSEIAGALARERNLLADGQVVSDREASFGGKDDQPTLAVRTTEEGWSEFGVFGMTPSFMNLSGPDSVATWLLGLSNQLDAVIGRSFTTSTVATIEETTGPDCLHWLQYFGPSIANRWSADSLRQGPFHKVWEFESGAVGMSLGRDPFDNLLSIKAAALHLGITLRPLMGKNMKGERVELNWT